MNKPVAIKLPHVVEIVAVGDGLGVVLPREVLDTLGVSGGDKVAFVAAAEGLGLRRHEASLDEQMKAARGFMAERHDALRELAK